MFEIWNLWKMFETLDLALIIKTRLRGKYFLGYCNTMQWESLPMGMESGHEKQFECDE